MKFAYEDLISGDSIPVDGVGHIRSPLLREGHRHVELWSVSQFTCLGEGRLDKVYEDIKWETVKGVG